VSAARASARARRLEDVEFGPENDAVASAAPSAEVARAEAGG
jgi:hypothetical protein